MIFLNLGCGGIRPPNPGMTPPGFNNTDPSPWINVDNLFAVLGPGEASLENLKKETNYVNCDLRDGLSFEDNYADGIVLSHFLEHLDCQECVKFLDECYRVLKPGGTIRISVPDAKKFYDMSVAEQAGEKVNWGQMCPHPEMTFMQWALFFFEHKQVLGLYGIFCMLLRTKFIDIREMRDKKSSLNGLADLDRSPEFSIFVEAKK